MASKVIITGSAAELSKLLSISQRRVNQLADEKIITRQPEGNFILPEAIKEFYLYKYKSDESINYVTEKALHERAKRQLAELDLRKRNLELHEAEDVELVLSEMLTNFRSQMLAIPSKMAKILENCSSDEIEETLTKEIEGRLLEVKDYSPTMFSVEDDLDGS